MEVEVEEEEDEEVEEDEAEEVEEDEEATGTLSLLGWLATWGRLVPSALTLVLLP